MAHADRPRTAPAGAGPGLAAVRTADDSAPASPAAPADLGPLLSSGELFAGGKQLRIAHQGQTYTLRITRENKLILTK